MKVIVVLPAYNAVRTLKNTIDDLPFECIDELVLVDDASNDDTTTLAHTLSTQHPSLTSIAEAAPGRVPLLIDTLASNTGYGGNQKRCYDLACARDADIVVMVHPDYQYDPTFVRYLVEILRAGHFDVMLGSRIRSRQEARVGGMPAYKYYANRALTLIGNIATGRNLSEWHTGLRAYRREVLDQVQYQEFSDDFIFDVQMLRSIIEKNFTIGDISVPVRYFDEASSINFSRSVRYGLLNLWEIFCYLVKRAFRARMLHYGFSGAVSFVTNLIVYILLLTLFDMWYITASVVAFCIGAVVSFALHKIVTFQEYSYSAIAGQFKSYVIILISNVIANAALLAGIVIFFEIDKISAAVVSNAIVACWSFFVYRHFVFSGRRDEV